MIGWLLWLPIKIILLPFRIVISLIFGIVRIFILIGLILVIGMFGLTYLSIDPNIGSIVLMYQFPCLFI
jgi:hypothetical protein